MRGRPFISYLLQWSLWLADRLPWFIRRPAINFIIGEAVLSEFGQSDLLRTPFSDICIKW